MRYFIISLTFSLSLAFSEGIISGNIIDKTNQLPLEGTNISLVGTDLGVISDKDGNFSISGNSKTGIIQFQSPTLDMKQR